MKTGRVEAFSDGVFAVAITVLVFGLQLPDLSGEAHPPTLVWQLLHAWPQYFAYVVSFLTIGIMWMNHHTALSHVVRVDRPLLVLNLLLLMGVVAIPFPTELVAEHLHDSGGTAAAVAYGLVMVLISIGFAGVWLYVVTHGDKVGARVPPDTLRKSVPGFTGGLLAYAAGTVVAAVWSATAALVIFGLLAVYYLFEHLPSPDGETGKGASALCPGQPGRRRAGREPEPHPGALPRL
jgi:TMEM175 potassium channel family protein